MFSKLFKKTKKEVAKSSIEKLNNNELKNVIGGLDSSGTDATYKEFSPAEEQLKSTPRH